jgi:hypothetical protein
MQSEEGVYLSHQNSIYFWKQEKTFFFHRPQKKRDNIFELLATANADGSLNKKVNRKRKKSELKNGYECQPRKKYTQKKKTFFTRLVYQALLMWI